MGHTSSWTHHTTLPGEPLSVLRARRFVCFHLVEHRLLYLVEDVRLVTSELAANAVRHAHTPFTVTLQQVKRAHPDNGYVLLTVHDGSPSPPVHTTPGVLDTSGRGVSIIDLVSQDWGVTDEYGGGKSVWASFILRFRTRSKRACAGTRPREPLGPIRGKCDACICVMGDIHIRRADVEAVADLRARGHRDPAAPEPEAATLMCLLYIMTGIAAGQ